MYEQDALSNDQTATADPATNPATLRQRAFDALLPQWTDARRDVAEARGNVEGAKGELKHATEALGRVERNLEHVASCRLSACLICEAIALNGARPTVEESQAESEDDSDEDPEAVAAGVVEYEVGVEIDDPGGVLSEEQRAALTELAGKREAESSVPA